MSASGRPPAGPGPEDMSTPADRLEIEAERARRGDDGRAGGPAPVDAAGEPRGRIARDTPALRRLFVSGLVVLAVLVLLAVVIAVLF